MKASTFKERIKAIRARAGKGARQTGSNLKSSAIEAGGGALAYGASAGVAMTGLASSLPFWSVPAAALVAGHFVKKKNRDLGAGMIGGATVMLVQGLHVKYLAGKVSGSAQQAKGYDDSMGYDAGAAVVAGQSFDVGALQGGQDFSGYDVEGVDDAMGENDAGALQGSEAFAL